MCGVGVAHEKGLAVEKDFRFATETEDGVEHPNCCRRVNLIESAR